MKRFLPYLAFIIPVLGHAEIGSVNLDAWRTQGSSVSVVGKTVQVKNSTSTVAFEIKGGTVTKISQIIWPDGTIQVSSPSASGGGSGTPGGSANQVQFNNAGAFGGDSGFTYNSASDSIVVAGTATLQGNAFSVGGSTFVVHQGSVAIGTTNLSYPFRVLGDVVFGAAYTNGHFDFRQDAANQKTILRSGIFRDVGDTPDLTVQRAGPNNGSSTSTPTGLNSGDIIGFLAAQGHDGTDYDIPGFNGLHGRIDFRAKSVPTQTNREGEMRVYVSSLNSRGIDTSEAADIYVSNRHVGIATHPATALFAVGNSTFVAMPTGKIGMGTSAPSATVHIVGSGASDPTAGTLYVNSDIGNDGNTGVLLRTSDNGAARYLLKLQGNNGSVPILTAASNGNIGLGKETPAGRLHVEGVTTITSTATIQGNAFSVGTSTFSVSGGTVTIGSASRLVLTSATINGVPMSFPSAECSNGQIWEWNSASDSWACGTDDTGGSGSADSLGSHTATKTLDMARFQIVNIASATFSGPNGQHPVIVTTYTAFKIALTDESDADFEVYESSSYANGARITTQDADNVLIGAIASSAAVNSITGSAIALGSDAAGDIMYYNGADYVRLPIGTASQVLKVNSGATAPEWGAGGSGGGGGWTQNGTVSYTTNTVSIGTTTNQATFDLVATAGTNVFEIRTATASDFTEFISWKTKQEDTVTTDGSSTTIVSIDVATGNVVYIEAKLTAFRTGGAEGAAAYDLKGAFYRPANQLGPTKLGNADTFAYESDTDWNVYFATATDSVQVRVLGETGSTVKWNCTAFSQTLSTDTASGGGGGCAVGDGQIGNSASGSNLTGRVNDVFYFSTFTVTTEGTVNFGHVKFAANSGSNRFGVYKFDGSSTWNLVSSGTVTGTAGTGERKDVTLAPTDYCLSSGTYAIGIVSTDTSFSMYAASLTNSVRRSISMTHSGGLPSTLDVAGSTLNANNDSYIITVNNVSNAY